VQEVGGKMHIIKSKKYPYFHIGLGVWITSKEHYRREMRKQDCVEVGTEDTRQPKHQGMTARDMKETYHPGSTNGERLNPKYYQVTKEIK
jgi:hypothetical protein